MAQPITPQTSSQGFHKNCRDESQNKETTLISHLNYDKRLDTSSGLHQQERQDQLHFNQYHKKKWMKLQLEKDVEVQITSYREERK